jgi:hypothetical protein
MTTRTTPRLNPEGDYVWWNHGLWGEGPLRQTRLAFALCNYRTTEFRRMLMETP